MKLREKIEKILFGDNKTKNELEMKMPVVYIGFQNSTDSILSLIQQEVSECIGEDEKHTEDCESRMNSDYHINCICGAYWRNQLRSDIKEKLKQKGIL